MTRELLELTHKSKLDADKLNDIRKYVMENSAEKGVQWRRAATLLDRSILKMVKDVEPDDPAFEAPPGSTDIPLERTGDSGSDSRTIVRIIVIAVPNRRRQAVQKDQTLLVPALPGARVHLR